MEKEWFVSSVEESIKAAREILAFSDEIKIFSLLGELGAGKTLLVKAMAEHLGCLDEVRSPTYSLVNEYHCPNSLIYHFDLYRMETVEEIMDIGFFEYIDSTEYCFIEWPERIVDYLPEKKADIYVSVISSTERKIRVKVHGRNQIL